MADEQGWEQFKRGVKRLKAGVAKPVVGAVAQPLLPLKRPAPRQKLILPTDTPPKRPSAALRLLPALTQVDDPQLLRRIEQGKARIDATLDLHHRTESGAHQAVLDFLVQAQQKRWRILRIITGCGDVLRPALPRWLATSQAAPGIRWIAAAAPRHGGGGALIIVLRGDKSRHK